MVSFQSRACMFCLVLSAGTVADETDCTLSIIICFSERFLVRICPNVFVVIRFESFSLPLIVLSVVLWHYTSANRNLVKISRNLSQICSPWKGLHPYVIRLHIAVMYYGFTQNGLYLI